MQQFIGFYNKQIQANNNEVITKYYKIEAFIIIIVK